MRLFLVTYFIIFVAWSQTTPTNFTYTKVRLHNVTLSWSGSDSSYEIFKNGNRIVTTNDTIYNVINLEANKNYTFQVRSVSGGSVSNFSAKVVVRTGLFPLMQKPSQHAYTYTAPPSAGLTTRVNVFSNTEGRVSQRSVSGDTPRIMKDYSKLYATGVDANGNDAYVVSIGSGSGRNYYDYNDYTKLADKDTDRFLSPTGFADEVSYSSSGNQLKKTVNGVISTIYTATGYRSDYRALLPTGESGLSHDGKYVALEAYKSGSTNTWCIVYDLTTNSVKSEKDLGDFVGAGSVAMSASGRLVTAQFSGGSTTTEGFFTYNNDATLSGKSSNYSVSVTGHGDNAVSIQGNDVYACRDNGKIQMYILEGANVGTSVDLFQETSRDAEISHASGKSNLNHGWAFFDNKFNSPSGVSLFWFRKVFAVRLDENIVDTGEDAYIRHYARVMYSGTLDGTGNQNSSYPTPSRDGTKVFFNNYLGTNSTSYDNGEIWWAGRTALHGDEVSFNPPLKKSNSQIIAN